MQQPNLRKIMLGGVLLAGMLAAASADAVDWGSVPGNSIIMFYPGQTSWEFILTPSDHDGAEKFRGGKDCLECHEDEESDMGKDTVSGKKHESNPIPDKPGSLPVDVKLTYDQERMYVQLSWKDTGFKPADHDSDKLLHVNMMLGDGTVPSFSRGGCWASCHADMKGMPYASSGTDLTKYLARSRTKVTREGGGENYKSDGDLQGMLGDGMFVEYWQAMIADAGAQAEPVDGYILEKRHVNDMPAVSAEASLQNGTWTVTLSRALKAARAGEKSLAEGKTYYVGFAIHDGYADGRHHYVSFKRTLTLGGGDGELVAKKQ